MTGPRPHPPVATYRIQFRNGVTLDSARQFVPYLDDLGVTDLYASPIFHARSGSTHGYDVVDPTRLDPTLGDGESLRLLSDELRSRDMGLVLDIVPNHMSTSTENPWWRDVLRGGPESPYSHYFDIDWEPPGDPALTGRVLLPVLGQDLDAAIDSGDLEITTDPSRAGEPVLRYFDLELPLAGGTDPAAPLRDVLAAQHYVLEHWRAGPRRINWRRFFGLTELVGVRVEDASVFDATHALIGKLVREGAVTGLRVDHIDGLRDPEGYLERLQELCGDTPAGSPFPVLVEKILGRDERLPRSWPVAGTTGYEFTDAANGLFVDRDGFDALESSYRAFTGETRTFDQIVDANKRRVIDQLFTADLARIAHRRARDEGREGGPGEDLWGRMFEATVELDVYRTYERGPEAPGWLLDWQQMTGAVTAKAVEDTTFYEYVPLASVNTVGSGPDFVRPDAVEHFHAGARERLRFWPYGLNGTSTHDSKRGEDARVRLDVLSEMPDAWASVVRDLSRRTARLRRNAGGPAPDPIDEILLYQAIVGSWPPTGPTTDDFTRRVADYAVKAAREAKRRTSWHEVDATYEAALVSFVTESLADPETVDVLAGVVRTLAWHGVLNSLSQVVVKVAAPGVPDVYQGAELWNLALVDPDNRRPVDMALRRRLLADVDAGRTEPAQLLRDWGDGRIKLLVTARSLRARRHDPDLFIRGDYVPLRVRGPLGTDVVAFARRFGDRWAAAVAPRHTTQLAPSGEPPTGRSAWSDAVLPVPAGAPLTWTDVLTRRVVHSTGPGPALADVLAGLPVALLVSHPSSETATA